MKYNNIILFTALLSVSLFTPVAFAADAQKDNFDARIEQINKRLEADRAQWEKRKNMSFEERRAQDDARWAEIEKQYKAELVAGKKRYEAIKADWEKRKNMSFEELRALDDARWAEREKQYKAAEAKMGKKQ
jgi:hypothetical protein